MVKLNRKRREITPNEYYTEKIHEIEKNYRIYLESHQLPLPNSQQADHIKPVDCQKIRINIINSLDLLKIKNLAVYYIRK